MEHPSILVIGSTNTDMVVQAPVLPAPGQTVLGGEFRLTPGGKGANQAVAAARAGGAVTFITAVGQDTFGQESLQRFAQDGIDTQYIVSTPDAPSGVALIMVDARGENMITVAPGANALLTPAHLEAAAAAFAHAQMVILQLEIPLDTVTWAIRHAQSVGCPVLLNPAPMPEEGLSDAMLAGVTVLTPNAGELQALAPQAASLEEAAQAVLARGPQVLVVTRGKEGASVFTRDGVFHQEPIQVTPVDTVGAGDCFSATLGVALAEGRPLQEAVRFATCAAGLSTTRIGAQAGMPTREEILRQM